MILNDVAGEAGNSVEGRLSVQLLMSQLWTDATGIVLILRNRRRP